MEKFLNPQRKSCGFENIRIRVDRALVLPPPRTKRGTSGNEAAFSSRCMLKAFCHFNFKTAILLRPVDSLSSKDVHCRALYRNLNLHPTTTVCDSHSKHRTFRSRSWPCVKQENMFAVLSGLHARIIHVNVTFRTLTPISLQSSMLWQIFFRFLAPQRYVPISFGITKLPRYKRTGRHFESV